jgi:hypothetical protein
MSRAIGLLLLLAAGVVSLPTSAYFLDAPETQNYVVPAQLAGMAAVGALVAMTVPGVVQGTTGTKVFAGAAFGVTAALVGLLLFWLLLTGLADA